MQRKREPLRYEDAAEKAWITLEGGAQIPCWISIRSRSLYTGPSAEHMARYHDCDDMPCECGGRREKHYTICSTCRALKADNQWFHNLEKNGVDWDGATPLCEEDGDRFLWDADEIQDYIDRLTDEGIPFDDIRLVLAKPNKGRYFEMSEYLSDDLPEEGGPSDKEFDEINAIVNKWIDDHAPYSWSQTQTPVKMSSLRNLFISG